MPSVRLAELNDISEVSSLLAASWKHAYRGILDDGFLDAMPDDRWVEFLNKGLDKGTFICLVAEEGGRLMGAAVLRSGAIGKMPDYGELTSLYVRPGETRKGVGSALLEKTLVHMRDIGLKYCLLDVLDGNENAVRFYFAHGFELMDYKGATKLGGSEYLYKYMRKRL